jgi:hypothetical protein
MRLALNLTPEAFVFESLFHRMFSYLKREQPVLEVFVAGFIVQRLATVFASA